METLKNLPKPVQIGGLTVVAILSIWLCISTYTELTSEPIPATSTSTSKETVATEDSESQDLTTEQRWERINRNLDEINDLKYVPIPTSPSP